jgi:hypothetical protein
VTPRSKRGSGTLENDKPSAFENVSDQIGYCGLWCGSCLVGNGRLNDLAKGCAKAITDYGVNDWGPKDIDYSTLLKGLGVISSMKPCAGCVKGGGRTNCEIRACAKGKGLQGCVECGRMEKCKNSKIIRHMRSGAQGVGMKVREKTGNRSRQIGAWTAELKRAQ